MADHAEDEELDISSDYPSQDIDSSRSTADLSKSLPSTATDDSSNEVPLG